MSAAKSDNRAVVNRPRSRPRLSVAAPLAQEIAVRAKADGELRRVALGVVHHVRYGR